MNEVRPPTGDDADAQPAIRAAQYIRMSTEHQQYSTENQSDMIKEYAQQRGFEIIKTYADEGKSGLRIEGRDALRQLIDDVLSGQADYEANNGRSRKTPPGNVHLHFNGNSLNAEKGHTVQTGNHGGGFYGPAPGAARAARWVGGGAIRPGACLGR